MFTVNELIEVTKGRLLSGEGNPLAKRVCIDSRKIKEGELFIAVKGERFDGHDFVEEALGKKAAAAVVDNPRLRIRRAYKQPVIKVEDALKALADIARYHRSRFDLPVMAITGTNGKTTIKEMIAWILEKKFKVLKNPATENNQIGVSLALLNLDSSFDIAVLEVGTNHFGEIGYITNIARPHIGIINNVYPAHLEFLKNLEGVYREKTSLINSLRFPKLAILNTDDAFLRRNKSDKDKFVVTFGINTRCDFRARGIKRSRDNKIEFLVNRKYAVRLNTIAKNNVYNALAAISAVRLLGMGYHTIIRQLSDFEFPPSRGNPLTVNKTTFIDDTYNSNPVSLTCALETLNSLKTKGRKIIVMGDMLELGSEAKRFHRQAGKKIAGICDILVTVGKLSKITARAALKSGLNKRSVFRCDSSGEAGRLLYQRVSPDKNDIILVKGSRLMRMERIFTAHQYGVGRA